MPLKWGYIMEIKRLDFERILTIEEIEQITDEQYNNINNFCTKIFCKQNDFPNFYGIKYRYNKHSAERNVLAPDPLASFRKDIMGEAIHYKNSKHPTLNNIKEKNRELILTNLLIRNDDWFIHFLNQSIEDSQYDSIQDLIEEINKLQKIYIENKKKYNIIYNILKPETKMLPLLKTFYQYYRIDDINVIINKINETLVKNPTLFEESKIIVKK